MWLSLAFLYIYTHDTVFLVLTMVCFFVWFSWYLLRVVSAFTSIRIKTHTSGGFKNQRLHRWRTAQRWCTEKEGVARPSIKQVLRLLSESCDPLHLELATAVEEDKGWSPRGDLASSSRSHCSRSFLVETGSPPNGLSFRFTSRILALRVIKLFSNCNFGR